VTRLEKALEGLGSKLEQYMNVFTNQSGLRQSASANSAQQEGQHDLLYLEEAQSNSYQAVGPGVPDYSINQQNQPMPGFSPPSASYHLPSTFPTYNAQPAPFYNSQNPPYQHFSPPPQQPITSTSQLPATTRTRAPSIQAVKPPKRARVDDAVVLESSTTARKQQRSATSSARTEPYNNEDSRDNSDQEPSGWPDKALWKPGGVHTELHGVLPYSTPGSAASSRENSHSPIESMALPQSNLHRPFDALADAVAAVEIMEQQQRASISDAVENLPGASPLDAEGQTPTGSTTTDTSERRRKRLAGVRRRGITRSGGSMMPSVISQNILSLHEGWRLFDFYKRSCHPFVPVLSEVLDTFDTLQREPMLLNSILAVAATRNKDLLETRKDKAGPNVRSLIVAEVSNNVHISLHRPAAGRGLVQALVTFSAWHHYPFSLAGHALRMAVELRLYLAMDKLLNPATRHPDETEEELYASARIWLATIWLDFQ
jgi:hypothetical protein